MQQPEEPHLGHRDTLGLQPRPAPGDLMPLCSAPARLFSLRSRLRAIGVAAVCLAALCQAPASTAAAAAERGSDLQNQIEQLVHALGGPPGVIAVLRRDGHAQVVRAGVADLATGRRPSQYDRMRIASTAKALSGAVALTLVDRHTLRLNETLGERLPRLPKAWHRVTLRQLLNHTSGLPDFSAAPEFRSILAADPHHHFDSRRLLDFVADQPLNFRPGSQYRYSNSDNIAVALMAEAATGTRYELLLRMLVDRPLGLHDTTLPQGYM